MIGTTLQIVGESLSEAVDVAARWRVLDVAAATGTDALAAARRKAEVTASDYVEGLTMADPSQVHPTPSVTVRVTAVTVLLTHLGKGRRAPSRRGNPRSTHG